MQLAGRFVFQAAEHSDARNEQPVDCDKDKSVQRATWIFKSTQREHEIKLRMLHIELERAELQKQAAINELKTSELKKQLIQDQVDDYYRSSLDDFNSINRQLSLQSELQNARVKIFNYMIHYFLFHFPLHLLNDKKLTTLVTLTK